MNSRSNKEKKDLKALDEMVEVIIVDACGDDEQLWAFRQTFEDDIDLPADGFVIGEPVSVMEIDYDGNERRGLTARCRREDGSEYVVAVSEVVFPEGTEGGWHIDAHSHLGNFVFDHYPQDALRHYEVGLLIGELSLGKKFNGVLHWGTIDNRVFLRCLRGYGLCLWRLGRFDEALSIFNRILWLNPSDNQGVRFLLDEVRAKIAWEDSKDEDRWH